MRHWIVWGVALAVATFGCGESALAQAGRPVRVVVVDSAGAPLQDALVSWMPSGLLGRSGPDGVARFESVLFGPEILTVRRLGYERISTPIAIDTLEPEEVKVVLRQSVAHLRAITVEDTASRPWLSEFDERRRRGLGQFVTIDKINKSHGGGLDALLQRTVRGIVVRGRNDFDRRIFSTRGPNSFGASECQVAVFIDGIRQPEGNAAEVPLQLIGGIEYYSPSEVPVRYKVPAAVGVKGGPRGGSPACGVMLMWTR
jgi:hypothetical protein